MIIGYSMDELTTATGTIRVNLNRGYAHLDAPLTIGTTTPTNAWFVDQTSGKVNVTFFGTVNLNNNEILDVQRVTGMFGKWSIDENGKVTAEEIETGRLKAKTAVECGSQGRPIGATIYDEDTAEPFCMKMTNAQVALVAGVCQPIQNDSLLTGTSTLGNLQDSLGTIITIDSVSTTTATTTP